MAAPIDVALSDGVFRITLNRPEVHNAFDDSMVEALRQAVERAAMDREARVVLLAGAGPSFCAGADIAWMRESGGAGKEENLRSAERMARLFLSMDRLGKPLVARVHGAAIGGGLGLAAVSDIALAASGAVFALSEVRLGIIPAVIAPYLVRRVGPGRARELVLTGRRFRGDEALAFGLVNRVVDDSLLDAAVDQVIEDLKKGGPHAQSKAKEALREIEVRSRTPEESGRYLAGLIAEVREGEEARAGLAAFLEKSPPPWAPRVEPRL